MCPVVYTGVPDKIRGQNKLEYNPVSLTAVNLTWGQPFDNNSPIINYIVSCDICPTTSTVLDANVTNLVIDGLTPGVEYKFNVAALNILGAGLDSNTVNALSATPGIHICSSFVYILYYMQPVVSLCVVISPYNNVLFAICTYVYATNHRLLTYSIT